MMAEINLYSWLMSRWRLFLEKLADKRRYARDKRVLLEELMKLSFEVDLERSKSYLNDLEKILRERTLFPKVYKVDIRSRWRSVVHARSTFGIIPFEMALAFDYILNVPYIPSSSIKGTLRRRLRNPNVLGTKEEMSKVVITDAYPVSGRLLFHPDVVTPHYENAVDEMAVRPNPLIFLTIAPNVQFRFFIGIRKPEEVDIDDLREGLQRALDGGVGAKTNVGYSSFDLLRFEEVMEHG